MALIELDSKRPLDAKVFKKMVYCLYMAEHYETLYNKGLREAGDIGSDAIGWTGSALAKEYASANRWYIDQAVMYSQVHRELRRAYHESESAYTKLLLEAQQEFRNKTNRFYYDSPAKVA